MKRKITKRKSRKISKNILIGIIAVVLAFAASALEGGFMQSLFKQDMTAALAKYGSFVGWVYGWGIPLYVLMPIGLCLLIGIYIWLMRKM